jgi:hypothetical protein
MDRRLSGEGNAEFNYLTELNNGKDEGHQGQARRAELIKRRIAEEGTHFLNNCPSNGLRPSYVDMRR